jgi:hypothetical protein
VGVTPTEPAASQALDLVSEALEARATHLFDETTTSEATSEAISRHLSQVISVGYPLCVKQFRDRVIALKLFPLWLPT